MLASIARYFVTSGQNGLLMIGFRRNDIQLTKKGVFRLYCLIPSSAIGWLKLWDDFESYTDKKERPSADHLKLEKSNLLPNLSQLSAGGCRRLEQKVPEFLTWNITPILFRVINKE